jgi:hypothetical protein
LYAKWKAWVVEDLIGALVPVLLGSGKFIHNPVNAILFCDSFANKYSRFQGNCRRRTNLDTVLIDQGGKLNEVVREQGGKERKTSKELVNKRSPNRIEPRLSLWLTGPRGGAQKPNPL